MMVPSSFLARDQANEKPRRNRHHTKTSSTPVSPLKTDKPSDQRSRSTSTTPVRIPSQRNSPKSTQQPDGPKPTHSQSTSLSIPPTAPPPPRKSFSTGSVETLLAATSIPVRRKAKSRISQRLPAGDHVADFSRLLSEDLHFKDGGNSLSGSFGTPQFDILFGANGENVEDAMFVGSEGVDPHGLSVRSISTESMPSLEIDEASSATSYSDAVTPSPIARRTTSDRRARVLSASEACPEDHPLSKPSNDDTPDFSNLGRWSPEARISLSSPPPKSRSSFRSNLTASLRALRSAAQTVSNFAASSPVNRPDDFLTRDIFTFSPELTDDKRPPPSTDPPSPALRRYLNPDHRFLDANAPSEFHSYSDLPLPGISTSNSGIPDFRPQFPASIQLQTYLPPTTRSSNGSASSPPRFGSPTPFNVRSSSSTLSTSEAENADGLVYNAHNSFHASPNLVRQREPRENPDFLRILVCEMQMRRKGKFGETMEGRACVWLPPRQSGTVGRDQRATEPGDRWKTWTAG